VEIKKFQYANTMYKYFYPALIAILLFSVDNANAATNVAQNADQNSPIITLVVDQYSDPISKAQLSDWISHKNTFSLSPTIKSEFENTKYCPVKSFYCEFTMTKISREHLRLSTESLLDSNAIKAHIEDLSRKVNRDPQEPKFKAEGGVVTSFSEAQNGIELNIEKSSQLVYEALSKDSNTPNQKIELPFDSKKVATNYGDVNNLGISSLIGQGVSNFKGSPKNRIFNIKVATDRFNGLLIKPGEEFSFVKNLGEVDAEHGYLPELVIKNNVTEPEFGGGICQVSSTAFRAAIYSGLKITARRNHAYAVSYYNPAGMDSTVYLPNPDLRFVNNTPNYILIQTKIVGTVLTFDFYGTDDGRKTTVDGPYTTDKQPDGSLKAHFTQNVIDKDGKVFINDLFNSSYGSPYKYPHPGGPILTVKPANWSNDEWKAYKKTARDNAKNTP
jgi:vancomycin resistance protein YoaR